MKKIRLFPRKTKYFGIAIILLGWVPLLLIKKLGWLPKNEELGLNILRGIILFGFLLIILSKEKIEDEFVDSCRLLAFRAAFLFGLVAYIINAISNDQPNNPFVVLLTEVLIYLSFFYTFKSGKITKW
mgnify:CR=1 FL=1